jgi:hypothetical protein
LLAIYELLDIMFWHIYQTFIKFKILNKFVCRALFVNDSTYRPRSDFNKEVSYFQLEDMY